MARAILDDDMIRLDTFHEKCAAARRLFGGYPEEASAEFVPLGPPVRKEPLRIGSARLAAPRTLPSRAIVPERARPHANDMNNFHTTLVRPAPTRLAAPAPVQHRKESISTSAFYLGSMNLGREKSAKEKVRLEKPPLPERRVPTIKSLQSAAKAKKEQEERERLRLERSKSRMIRRVSPLQLLPEKNASLYSPGTLKKGEGIFEIDDYDNDKRSASIPTLALAHNILQVMAPRLKRNPEKVFAPLSSYRLMGYGADFSKMTISKEENDEYLAFMQFN